LQQAARIVAGMNEGSAFDFAGGPLLGLAFALVAMAMMALA